MLVELKKNRLQVKYKNSDKFIVDGELSKPVKADVLWSLGPYSLPFFAESISDLLIDLFSSSPPKPSSLSSLLYPLHQAFLLLSQFPLSSTNACLRDDRYEWWLVRLSPSFDSIQPFANLFGFFTKLLITSSRGRRHTPYRIDEDK